jgi:hypothetical protein
MDDGLNEGIAVGIILVDGMDDGLNEGLIVGFVVVFIVVGTLDRTSHPDKGQPVHTSVPRYTVYAMFQFRHTKLRHM